MSVPFSTTSSDTPSRGYLRALALGVAIWLGLFLIFTWTVDPYGVSPMQLALRGINTQKPKRVDIDRLIKPYEVWGYQPRTGFSRHVPCASIAGSGRPRWNAICPCLQRGDAGSLDGYACRLSAPIRPT